MDGKLDKEQLDLINKELIRLHEILASDNKEYAKWAASRIEVLMEKVTQVFAA